MLSQPPAHCLCLPAESRTRASIAVPSYEHATSFKRPHSTISNSSTSSSSSQSSSSLLGSLNLHLYSSPSHPYPTVTSVPSFGQWPYDCIEEDELEQDTGSQPSIGEPFDFCCALLCDQLSSLLRPLGVPIVITLQSSFSSAQSHRQQSQMS